MAANNIEHSPHDHNKYFHRPKAGAHFPTVPPERLIYFISTFEFYANASFLSNNFSSIMATLFLGEDL